MKRLDEISINEYGIPGLVLMENAGLAVVEELEALSLPEKRGLVLCGTGNNGGDGFVIARHLHNRGWSVSIIICGEAGKIKDDALTNLHIARRMGIPLYSIEKASTKFFRSIVTESPLIVDALLGTGFKGELKGLLKSIIGIVNESKARVVSVDIPSGLDADTGFSGGGCIFAELTVTFQLPKVGLLINEGPKTCGILKVKDISIPKAAVAAAELRMDLLDEDMIRALLTPRASNTHKGSFGSVLVAACSKGMEGSGLMSSMAALRSGAGIVRLGLPDSLRKPMAASAMEIMTLGLEDKGTGILTEACIPQLLESARNSSVLLIGPGLTAGEGIRQLMAEVIRSCPVPMVIDADGLNAVSADPDILKERKEDIVITPHPGEMARLCGCSGAEIQRDRIGYAVRFAREHDVIVVLKGYRTIIATPEGNVSINPTGNPGMATAGSGDVLAGIIAGLAAQKFKLEAAARCGVYIHGAAGDYAAAGVGEYGLTAGDIIGNIPHTIKSIAGK